MERRKDIIRNLRNRAGLSKGQAAVMFRMEIQEWERFENGEGKTITTSGGMHIFQKLYAMAEEREKKRRWRLGDWLMMLVLMLAVGAVISGFYLMFSQ